MTNAIRWCPWQAPRLWGLTVSPGFLPRSSKTPNGSHRAHLHCGCMWVFPQRQGWARAKLSCRARLQLLALASTGHDSSKRKGRPPVLFAQYLFDQTCELADIANDEHPAMLLNQAGAGEIVEFPRHSFAVGAYATCDFRMR